MIDYDAIVIGGGINGIAAACLLSKNGKSVAILEQRSELGGMATHNRAGPPAAHLLWNVSPTIIKDLGLGQIGSKELTPMETICFCENGNHIRVKQDTAFYFDGTSADPNYSFKKLTKLLTKEMKINFNQAIEQREKHGITSELTFIGFKDSNIEKFEKINNEFFATVKFVSEIISVKKDGNNKVIEGNSNKIKTVTDYWKFSKKTSSQDPNWFLSEIISK